MIAAIGVLIEQAFMLQLSPPETWLLIQHHIPAATLGDVLDALEITDLERCVTWPMTMN